MRHYFKLLTVALAARALATDTSPDLIWSKNSIGDSIIYKAAETPKESPKAKPRKGKPVEAASSIVGEVRINCQTHAAIIVAGQAVQLEMNDGMVFLTRTKTALPDDEAKGITEALACDAYSQPDDTKVEAGFPQWRAKYFPPPATAQPGGN